MEELQVKTGPFTGSAKEFDTGVKKSIETQKEEFVRTGWFLRSAEETGLYKELGYKSLAEYAKEELALPKDIVSRYKNINRRYSEGGYSEFLKEEFRGYGVGKLEDMLNLSDEVVHSLSKDLTRREIQEVKREIEQEKKITDLEVMMEPTPAERPEFDTLAQDTLYQYLKENKEEFKEIYTLMEAGGKYEEITEKLLDIIAPSGIAAKTVRIPGKGKIMISIKGKDEKVDFLNVRTNEKESVDWNTIVECLNGIFKEAEWAVNEATAYEELYGEPLDTPEETPEIEEIKEKPEVAPVQQEYKESVTTAEENKETVNNPVETSTESKEEKEQPAVEKVIGEVVEETREIEKIKEKLAEEFIKRYSARLEYSENMRDEVSAILDKVHKSVWIMEYKGEEYFVVEAAGYIKLQQREEIITTLYWPDFYQLMHKVYWKESENEEESENCTGATEEQVQGQTAIEDYPEYLPENVKSNMEIWQEVKAQVKARIESISKAAEEDNYALIKWDAKKLVELLEEIR